jgi:cysteine desulfurase/selenocysteine lyase
MEHHSNLVPWQILAAERGIELRFIPVTNDGRLDLAALPGLLADGHVKLVGVVHISNVLGTINPVEEIARAAHAAGSLVLVDASRSVPHRRVDVQRLGADFIAFTGHKMLGPTGIGALWARRTLLGRCRVLGGGEMIREVAALVQVNELPWGEAGTMAVPRRSGSAPRWTTSRASAWTPVFCTTARWSPTRWAACRVPGLTMLGPPASERGGVVAFTMQGIHPHDIATVLDRQGVAIRAGHHCAMPLHERLAIPASARASFYCYSIRDEVDALIAGLHKARALFKQ